VIERVQEKYIKWILGLDKNTPGYIVREEMKTDKIRVDAGKLAVKYEDRMRERVHCKILQECWKMRRMTVGNDREAYYKRNGYAIEEIERRRENGRWMYVELCERDRDIEKQERRERIRESRYNDKYEKLLHNNLPEYLKRESKNKIKMIARFRCGNEERDNHFWMDEKERLCRICGEGRETMEHMAKECIEMEAREERIEELLNGDGRGLKWMKEVKRLRGG